MSVTLGFVLRYDQAPAVPVPPTMAPAQSIKGVWVSPKKVAPIQAVQDIIRQPSADRFPAFSSTTYGSRGEPNRPWLPQQGHLDLYA